MNNLQNEDQRDVNAFIERQQRILQAVKQELHASHEKLKQTLRQHDDIFYRLFPPVRPGRDVALIGSRIEESRKQLARLRQAIFDQRLELESLLQSSSTSAPSVDADAESTQHSGDLPREEGKGQHWQDLVTQGRDNLAKLKKEFADTRLDLDKLEVLLSPIRLLPTEVLAEIFTYCLETTTYEPMSLNCGPLLITHVCSSWRSIAVNKANLWTNIWVNLENDDNKEGWPELVRLWVERSKELPLSFHIQETDTHNYVAHPSSAFFRCLDILLPQSHRWKSAQLVNRNFQASGEIEWFNKLPKLSGFPLLESITLQTRKLDPKEADRITDMMRSSPRLHDVTWMIKTSLSLPRLPWAQLTSLTLIFISTLEEAQSVLANSPQLNSLDISIQLLPGTPASPPTSHANLRTVYLSCAGNVRPLFDSLTLPNLRDLTIDQMPEVAPAEAVGPWPHDAFMAFLHRSKCSLRRFAMMDACATQAAELITLLRHLSPTLRVLEIENFDYSFVTDDVIKALMFPHEATASAPNSEGEDPYAGVLCPNVQEMKLLGCMDSTDGVLADMVLSRLNWPKNHPSLRSLKKGEFGARSPPERVLDQERLTGLHSSDIKYTNFEIY